MHCRRRNAEGSGCFLDCQKFAVGRFRFWLIARDFPLTPQTGDVVGLETMTISSFATLTIEDAGDYPVRIMRGQAANERNRILIGANDLRFGMRQVEVEFGQRTALPAHCDMRCVIVALNFDNNFFEQCSEQLLAVAW